MPATCTAAQLACFAEFVAKYNLPAIASATVEDAKQIYYQVLDAWQQAGFGLTQGQRSAHSRKGNQLKAALEAFLEAGLIPDPAPIEADEELPAADTLYVAKMEEAAMPYTATSTLFGYRNAADAEQHVNRGPSWNRPAMEIWAVRVAEVQATGDERVGMAPGNSVLAIDIHKRFKAIN